MNLERDNLLEENADFKKTIESIEKQKGMISHEDLMRGASLLKF